MKKIILLSLSFCLAIASISAQKPKVSELTDKQWDTLLTAVGKEDWKTTFDLSAQYIEFLKNNDDAKSIANLRYIYLYSAAGKVSEGSMTYDELDKNIKNIVGKKVALPFHPVSANCRGASLNFVCPSKDTKNKVMITATNSTGTTIHSFEYIMLKQQFDFAKHDGEDASVLGIVDSIEPNPNRSNLLIMRIYISDGEILLANGKGDK